MQVEELLITTLERLGKRDFKKFRSYCTRIEILPGCEPLPTSCLEDACETDTASALIDTYGEEKAVNITIEILKKIRQNTLAETLKKKYAAGTSTSSSAQSPPAAPPAAPAGAVPPAGTAAPAMLAQQGGVNIAPTISNCTIGTLNANYSKANDKKTTHETRQDN